MNKKKVLLILIVVFIFFLVMGIILFNYKKHSDERKKSTEEQQKRVQEIKDSYSNYITGEKLECNDKICNLLNEYIDIHQQINDLEVTDLELSEINNIDNSITVYNNLKDTISSWNYDNIDKYLKKYQDYEKKTILEIYNSSEITKSFKNDEKAKSELLKTIDNNLEILDFLVENDANFISTNYNIIYVTEEFKKEFSKYDLGITLVSIEEAYGKKIPILTYHGVDDNVWGNSSLFVRPGNFENQMQYLYENGYKTLFLSEIGQAAYYDKPVIITFDDGYLDMYTIAYPIMKARNIKSNMFIITDWLDGSVYMNPSMVKELSDSGLVEIGSHTVSHVHLNTLSYEEQEYQLKTSKEYLENLIGKEVNTIAYPYGQRNIDTLNIARNYYRFAVTTESGANYTKTYNGSSLLLRRFNMQRGTSFESFKSFVG